MLPSAVGIALSPVPIIAVVLMLATSKGRSNGLAFAVGWIAGLTAATVIVLVVTGGADDSGSTTSDSVNWVKVGLGVWLLGLAVRRWRGRPAKGETASMPKWMDSIDAFSPTKSLLTGAALSGVNPKNLILAMAGAASLAQAGLSSGEDAAVLAVFIAVASITVVGPVIAYLAAPRRAAAFLDGLKDFMTVHNTAIMVVILLVFGVKLIGDGTGALA
jgi:threonine/homoserine/homoserine lactone efflux protein